MSATATDSAVADQIDAIVERMQHAHKSGEQFDVTDALEDLSERVRTDEGTSLMTDRYVADRHATVHSYESFARAFADRILAQAREQIAQRGPQRDVEVSVKVQVSPIERISLHCLEICTECDAGPPLCIHVPFPVIED